MANEFKIKTGLLLGPSPTQPVSSITDSSSFTNDSSTLATVNAIKNYVDSNTSSAYWKLDGSTLVPKDDSVDVQLSSIQIETDAGSVSVIDMDVSSASSGTEESYSFDLDGNTMLKVYGEGNGSGGIQESKINIPVAFKADSSIYLTGIPSNSQTKSLYYNPTTGEVTYDDVSTGGAGGTATWGGITGTLSDQTDVSTAIDAKLNLSGGTLTGSLTTDDIHIGGGFNITGTAAMNPGGTMALVGYVSGTLGGRFFAWDGTNYDDVLFGAYNSSRGAALINMMSSGKVGINTKSPATDFDVDGSMNIAGIQYLGSPTTDGSWRFYVDGSGDLVFEKRVSGTWTEGGKFTV